MTLMQDIRPETDALQSFPLPKLPLRRQQVPTRPQPHAGREARLYRQAPSPLTSNRTAARPWILEFERQSPPWNDPLMGWTGGRDPLAHVCLRFPDATSARAYAARQDIRLKEPRWKPRKIM